MATIRQRNNSYYVIYTYFDETGTRKQKWETFKSISEARNRQKEVEYKKQIGSLIIPKCKTLDELLNEYIELYGKMKWSMSTYNANKALIQHYISPKIGHMKND